MIICVITYLTSLGNYKQLSYVARVGVCVTFLVIIYVTMEISIKYQAFPNQKMHQQAKVHFNPDFFNMFAQASGVYEGIPLLPPLYSNARNKKNFSRTVTFCIILEGSWLMFYAPLAVAVYGDKVREIILLNLDYGDI